MNSDIKDKNKTNPMNTRSPHFWWLFGIFIAIIVILIAYIYTKQILDADIIMTYVSFASVILSITLSIFAISFTHDSNRKMDSEFGQIKSATNDIVKAAKELGETNNSLTNNMNKIMEKLKGIEDNLNNGNNKAPQQTNTEISNKDYNKKENETTSDK